VLTDATDGVAYELGMKFQVARSGQITAVRYWKSPSDAGTHVGRIWSSGGQQLASVTFTNETASGWQTQALATPLTVQAATTYVVSVNIVNHYPYTGAGLASPIVNGDISSVADGDNGVFAASGNFPSGSFNNANYFRDVVFVASTIGPAAKLALSPATTNTQTGVAVGYTATVQDANGNTVTSANNVVTFGVTGVPGAFSPSASVAATNGVATDTFIPTASGTGTITASATGLTSATATVTVADPTASPQSLFTTQTPSLPSASDGVPYELGMKFQLARSGTITALRFWKSINDTGTHVGRIWSANGQLLTSVTFANETASGWQQQALPTALPVQANTTYVVSANIVSRYPFTAAGLLTAIVNGDISSVADGANGVFGTAFAFPSNSFNNANYFRDIVFVGDTVGAPAQLTLAPSSGNGQTGTAIQFTATIRDANGSVVTSATNPVTFSVSGVTGSFSPSTNETPLVPIAGNAITNFTATSTGTATITASSQGLGSATATIAITQGIGTPVRILLTPSAGSTQTGIAYPLTAYIQDANGLNVPTATNAVTFTLSGVSGTFNPASPVTAAGGSASTALTATTAGTATVTASANGLTSDSAIISVSGPPSLAPESLFTTQTPTLAAANDGVAYELGMKFTTGRPGRVTAIRYWKSTNDTVTHTGKIWSASGQLLGSVTFTGETGSGWQQQALATPVALQANTTYVVSVNVGSYYPFTSGGLATSIVNGDLSSVADGNNGVFGTAGVFPTSSFRNANYFRDVVLVPDAVPTIVKFSGDKQSGLAGSTLPSPLTVQVLDSNNNPLANVTVNFAVTSGGGSVIPVSTVTDVNGLASTNLTLGASGRSLVTATAVNIGSVVFSGIVPNAIYAENQQPGTSAWRITNPVTSTAPEIAGYAGATSVNRGGTLALKVTVAQPGPYTIDVYRLGYYGGAGGRLMASSGPQSGVTQAPCNVTAPATFLVECQWTTSYLLVTGSTWTSGLYVANLTHSASGKQSQIWFVVRDDSSTSDLVFQSSFNTFTAYNNYGDQERHSLYEFNSTGGQRAYKVSLDRPFSIVTTDSSGVNGMLRYERNMARWLESQGYDVSYVTNVDVHLNPSLLLQHKTFLSVGHDEYWSLEQRNAVEQARDAGKNLAFFSGNSAYWRVRFEPSTLGDPNRVMVCYKDPAVGDPVAPTYLWRGPENNRPENALLGIMYVGDNDLSGGYSYVVANATDPYYLNTGLTNGMSLDLLVGYEWDAVVNNGFTPANLVVLGNSPTTPSSIAPQPPGLTGTISNAARYTAASGAKVFAAGSIQLMWGLDSNGVVPPREDPRLKQFVINVLGDMGAKPLTPDDGLVVP
jgi:hypothetical protein